MRRKWIWMGLLLGCTVALQAATRTDSIKERGRDPLYVQLYGGINKSANEHLPWQEFSSYPWSGGLFVGMGREFNALWGWRAAVRYNHNKSRNVQECESSDTWGWDNVGLFGDVTLDVTDLLRAKANRGRGWFNLKLFAGVGGAYTFGFPQDVPLSYTQAYSSSSSLQPGVRAGLTATCKLAERWRIGAELSHSMFGDGFNGVECDFPMDGRSNLKVGVTYLFIKSNKRMKSRRPVAYDHRLRVVPELPLRIPEPEGVKVRRIAGRAFLDFPVNETVIYPKYRRNPQELQRIRTTVDSALFDKSIRVTHVSLHGYASPESPYDNNTRLAKGRTAALMEYLQSHYRLDEALFQNEYTPEDWQNLRDFIAAENRRRVKGDIWYENRMVQETPPMPDVVKHHREELLEVIDREMDPDEKELLLKQVGDGKPYRWLLQHVYPGLRHTDYVIEYVVESVPVKDGRRLIYTHPEALSLHEMYGVAQSYEEGSDGWLDALLIAARSYPDDETANLNAACACVKVKRLADAKRYLSRAGTGEEARYVAGVIRAMEGEGGWRMEQGKVVIEDYNK